MLIVAKSLLLGAYGRIGVAPKGLPPYRKRSMGQQHRRTVKRRRRTAYLERKKAKAKAAVPARREPAKPRVKKAPVAAEA